MPTIPELLTYFFVPGAPVSRVIEVERSKSHQPRIKVFEAQEPSDQQRQNVGPLKLGLPIGKLTDTAKFFTESWHLNI